MRSNTKRLAALALVIAGFAVGMQPAATWAADAPVPAPAVTVVGPTVTTTAPSTFINANVQVASGNASSGEQISNP